MEEQQKNYQDKILDFFTKNFHLFVIVILVLGFILRLKYLTINQAIWFDEAVYMSAAKNWAFNIPYQLHFVRPPLLPFIWTIFYKIGLGEFTFRIIIFLFSLAGLILTYLVGKILFNKYVGLIAMVLTSFHYMNLFYTTRLLTGIPSLTLFLLTVYFFLQAYINKKSNYLYWMGLAFVLSVLMRFPSAILAGIFLIYLLITQNLKFLKEKRLWLSIGVFFLIFIPYAIWYYIKYKKIAIIGTSAFYSGSQQILFSQSLNFLSTILTSPFYILIIALLIGLVILVFHLIIGYDLIKTNEKLKSQLFVFLWILLVFSYYAFYSGYIEDRYFFHIIPAFFMVIGFVFLKINNFLKRYHKFLGIVVILLLLCLAGYKQLNHADQLIKTKANSYIQFKHIGLWIKENSNEDDTIIASGEPFFVYYAERKSYWYPSTEEEFLEFLQKEKPKYMVLSASESSPEYTYSWPQNNQDKTLPVQGSFFDAEKTKPIIIVYQLIYS